MPTPIRTCCGLLLALLCAAAPKPGGLTITSLSSRPDMVSGGEVLVEIKGAGAQSVVVKLNGGLDVSSAFHPDASRGALVGLVTGLGAGQNSIGVKVGSKTAKLDLVNH